MTTRLRICSAVALAMAIGSAGAAFGGTARQATVTVTFTNAKLGISATTLGAGTTTFVVVNKARKAHVLAVSGPGLKNAHTPKIAAGRRARLTVKLRKGSYMLTDPALLAFQAQYVSVIAATSVAGGGGDNVPGNPGGAGSGMCGVHYTP